MDSTFEKLKSIKRVEAPDLLFEKIMQRIEENKKSIISIVWVKTAAAALICMISVEVYLVRDSLIEQERKSLHSILPVYNNMFYHE